MTAQLIPHRREILPNLDIELLAEHSRMADPYDAIQSLIKILRQG
jgi:hypothetical protein